MAALAFEVSVPQLRCFLAVVDAGSVAEAGRRLGMSAASVSKAITRLEDGAGVRLLHRSTHAISLTDAGEALLAPAREAVRAAEAFAETAAHASVRGDGGTVRLTAAAGMVRHVLAPLVGELARVHPDIRVDIRVTNRVLDLAEGGIDLAIRSGPFDGLPGHVAQPWFAAPWVLCATPGYLAGRARPASLRDLDGHDLVAFRSGSGRVLPWPHRDGSYEPKARFTFDDGDATFSAMLAGAGIACTPLYLAAASLRSGAAVEVLAPLRAEPVPISLLRRERRLTPGRLTKLIAFLNTHAPDLSDLL
ncbi:LysR family transcriptional regulator [Sorangium sp. So ce1153]|uniref:LysR family transcriptional regulator n=1 Tax=Sorangium sp. So ce1153 TaxID=3133333 RepID=UPI003F63D7B8